MNSKKRQGPCCHFYVTNHLNGYHRRFTIGSYELNYEPLQSGQSGTLIHEREGKRQAWRVFSSGNNPLSWLENTNIWNISPLNWFPWLYRTLQRLYRSLQDCTGLYRTLQDFKGSLEDFKGILQDFTGLYRTLKGLYRTLKGLYRTLKGL